MTTTHETRDQKCPWCEARLSKAANVDDARDAPSKDDVSVCLACAAPLVMGGGGLWLRLEPPDFAKLPIETQRELGRVMAGMRGAPKEIREW